MMLLALTTRSSFNPHTHTGCDSTGKVLTKELVSFNPHTHTGCDFVTHLIQRSWILVSIHTPIQGVTLYARYGY